MNILTSPNSNTMKKNYYLFLLTLSCCLISFGQQNDTKTLPTIIKENTKLLKNTTYTLESDVIISEGIILTIEEGVILQSTSKNNTTFLIESGAKIVACGSYENPIKAITQNNALNIIIRSVPAEKNDMVYTEDFIYSQIENPTVLMNATSAKSDVFANVTPDF